MNTEERTVRIFETDSFQVPALYAVMCTWVDIARDQTSMYHYEWPKQILDDKGKHSHYEVTTVKLHD